MCMIGVSSSSAITKQRGESTTHHQHARLRYDGICAKLYTLADDGALVMHFIRRTEPRLAKIQYSRKQYGCVSVPQTSAPHHTARRRPLELNILFA